MSHFCAACGAAAPETATHCVQCGTPLAPDATATMATGVPTGPPSSPAPQGAPAAPSGKSNTPLIVALAVLGTVLVLGIIALAVTVLSSDDDKETVATATTVREVTTTEATTTEATTPTTTTTAVPTTAPPPATAAPTTVLNGSAPVSAQPSGLFCRDLAAMGYPYYDAVEYWNLEGQPDRMDADLDGYPCETVYPFEDVEVYWFG